MESINSELPFFKSLMKGLTALFGPNVEVVLHDLKDQPYDSTIIAIDNGHVTGRNVGDCGTNLGLEVLRGSTIEGNAGHLTEDRYNYVTQTNSGRVLRSSSVYIHNDAGVVIGAFCINFDISDLMVAERSIGQICQNPFYADSNVDKEVREVFVRNVSDLLDSLIQEVQQMINKPVCFMTKDDKLRALKHLDERGAFLIKKSGDTVAKYFDISKYTMYSYLESIRTSHYERE
jgi:predicted transcriptional regulator YheO